MKRMLCLATLVAATLAGCGDDNNNEAERLIGECVADGGTPYFTADRSGDIQRFMGCKP